MQYKLLPTYGMHETQYYAPTAVFYCKSYDCVIPCAACCISTLKSLLKSQLTDKQTNKQTHRVQIKSSNKVPNYTFTKAFHTWHCGKKNEQGYIFCFSFYSPTGYTMYLTLHTISLSHFTYYFTLVHSYTYLLTYYLAIPLIRRG